MLISVVFDDFGMNKIKYNQIRVLVLISAYWFIFFFGENEIHFFKKLYWIWLSAIYRPYYLIQFSKMSSSMQQQMKKNNIQQVASILAPAMYDGWGDPLTHWGRVTHKCVGNIKIIGSDNGLSPGRRQAILWTNDGILLIEPIRTNFSEIWTEIHTFFQKMRLKRSSAKWRPFCLPQCMDWIGFHLYNDDTCSSGHISRPSQVGFSHNCFRYKQIT